MQITDLTSFCLSLEVAVKQRDGQEESLVIAFKVGQHLNHPVNHASSQRRGYLVLNQAILSKTLKLKLPRVGHNLVSVLSVHINILPLNFIGRLSTQMGTGVHLREVRQDVIGVYHVSLANANAGCRLESRFAQVALCLVSGRHCLVQLQGSFLARCCSNQSLACLALFFQHLLISVACGDL